ncbi:MAG TPA: hypothetical protein DHV85_11295 [Candidatus Accumulibacter sp.]|nr:hypothetical protein [Accumulibacter sp.]
MTERPACCRPSAPWSRMLRGIWIGSEGGGLERFDPRSGSFSRHRNSQTAGSLPDDRVQALLLDRQGALWVGTWAGLSRLQPGSDHFEPVFSNAAANGGASLAGRIVQALFEASDGNIWAASHKGGVAVLDRQLRVVGALHSGTRPGDA